MSGPGGLAAALRTGLAGTELSLATPLTSISLPLDIGAGSEAIPVHLRRAVTLRHPHCAFPGCHQPASVCDVHHLVPRSAGGATALPNLVPLCRFHHLIAIHHWGWTLRLNPDGTTTADQPRRPPRLAQPQPTRPGRLTPAGRGNCRWPGVPSHLARGVSRPRRPGGQAGASMPGIAAPSPRRDRLSPAELAWATLSSPVGPLAVGCTAAGVAQVRFRTSTRDRMRAGRAGRPAGGGGRGPGPGRDAGHGPGPAS